MTKRNKIRLIKFLLYYKNNIVLLGHFSKRIINIISQSEVLTSLCSFLHFSAVTMSWYGTVGIVTDLMTLGGGGGALNTPSSLWEFVSLLLLDTLAF